MIVLFATARPAGAVDVSQLSDFEANPCVIALTQRSAAQHVDAPDSAIADACERAHDSPEIAWDFLTRIWLPHAAASSAAYGAEATLGVFGLALASLGMALGWLVLGRPIRALGWILAGQRERSRAARTEAVLCLVARLALALLLLAAMRVPLATGIAALALVAVVARAMRDGARRAVADAPGPASTLATVVAAVINDLAAAVPSLATVVLMSRGKMWLAAIGVTSVAVLASTLPCRRVREQVRLRPIALAAVGVALVIAIVIRGLGDPLLAGFARASPVVLVAGCLLAAALVIWRARLVARWLPGGRAVVGD